MSVQEGDAAPDFSLPASGGRTVSLAGMQGRPFVLYFYPKADTPGCTKEACAFQEALPQLGKIGIEVIGVSPDKIKPIEKFAEKYKLVDVPNSRRRHAHPMPIIGGLAVFATWFVGLSLYAVFRNGWLEASWHSLLPIAVSILILLGLGLVDDLLTLGPRAKLTFQFLAAAIQAVAGGESP